MSNEFITVNGRRFKAKELDFNFLCELGAEGVDITEIGDNILLTVRTYVAYCMGVKPDLAGAEINNHVVNGGGMKELIDVFTEKANESDFFQALTGETEKKETPKRNTKKKAEAEVSE